MGEIAAKEIVPINLEEELKESYLNYAMHVIVGRALPDARDGLKPVHRRILYAMHVMNNDWNKPPKKSMRIVGDVTGKYHPHGDTAAYETIVRLGQWWSLRYMLVDKQGNFGSMDGDPPAAARYTEARMSRIAHEILEDLDKETVKFIENYDGQETMPDVLPTRIPNLLINGSSGIAVGMATNMAPHNLDETISACLAFIENPEISIDELLKLIPGPDFPTGGIINGKSGIRNAYETGKGKVKVRAKTLIEGEEEGKPQIVISEIPYMVNKARLVENIAHLMRDKKIEGIKEIRDESDKDDPVRIVVELRSGAIADVVLNNLFKQTQMQTVFGINNVALVGTEPKLLNLKDILGIFFNFRKEVVSKRTIYELRRARERGHILEGLTIALSNIDPMIDLIKKSKDGNEAKAKLLKKKWKAGKVTKMLKKAGAEACRPEDLEKDVGLKGKSYQLSENQAQAILDMRLQRLTGLEQDRLIKEYEEIVDLITSLMEILSDNTRLIEVVCDELKEIQTQYKDERRTEIQDSIGDLNAEDLITPEDRVVTISHEGYAKTQPLDEYRSQRRGGTGKTAASVKEEDFVEQLLVANTHTTLLCFSNLGQVYWLKVYDIPSAGRVAKGRPLVNLIQLNEGERITSMVPVDAYKEGSFVLMATKSGTVKKTPLTEFSNRRKGGKRAITLVGDDELVGSTVTNGKKFVMLVSNAGKAAHFSESEVRSMGRSAQGVRGIKLEKGQQVISLIIPEEEATIFTVSKNGFGKRSVSSDFRKTRRGAKGVIAMQTSERNGQLIGAAQVSDEDQVMLITNKGMLVRTKVSEINVIGRNTQGVTVIKLKEGEKLVNLAPISEEFIDDALNNRKYNFGAGPATIPTSVLEEVKEELLDWKGKGLSVLEISHRSDDYQEIAFEAEKDFRDLLSIPDSYAVLFTHGGATLQNAAIPLNLSSPDGEVSYVNSGYWANRSIEEAKKYTNVRIAASSKETNFSFFPPQSSWKLSDKQDYIHVTPNETIGGIALREVNKEVIPIVADFSSSILSEPIEVSSFGLIYGGAQKNIGPAGLGFVIVNRELLGSAQKTVPSPMNYLILEESSSMYNTPPTFSWYVAGKVFKWLKGKGGLKAIGQINEKKAKKLYDFVDRSDLYSNKIEKSSRSIMNIPFLLEKEELNSKFLTDSSTKGLLALKGHRSVGGMRASIYNAMPEEGVEALIEFMRLFERENL